MEDLSTTESTVTPEQERIASLEEDLTTARQRAGWAIGQLEQLKQNVRATVIERIKDGTICRPGANEALDSWGLEEYQPRYNVRVALDVEVTVDADDEDAARENARDAVNLDTGDYDHYLHEAFVTDVQEIDD